MRATVDNLGAVGLIADKEPTSLPLNAWTTLSNTRCVDRSIASFAGYTSLATVTDLAESIELVQNTSGTNFLVYGAGSSIYSVTDLSETGSGTEVEIGSGFSGSGKWDSTVLGGVAIFTNGVSNPQYWGGSGNTLDVNYDETGTEVCTWTDVGMSAKLIRAYRFHLFALNIEDCDGKNCRKVHWSTQAEPGTLPITWDPTLPEYDAGFYELTDTPGCIVDARQLRDTLQIYKTDAIYSVTPTFDNNVFNFRLVTTAYGLYARNCVCDIGGRHFFVGDGEIFLYDGGTDPVPIGDERVKNLFFDSVSRENRDATFCIFYERTHEVWLCYPEEGDTACTKALVYDVRNNVWAGQRDLPSVSTGIFAVVDRSSGYTWDTLPYATWDSWGDTEPTDWTSWDALVDGSPFKDSLILSAATDFYEMDRTNQANGSNIVCQAQRVSLDLGDKMDFHCVLRMSIRAQGDAFSVRVGSLDVTGATPTWSDYQTFTPGTSYKLDFRVTGRTHAVEFYSNADVAWNIEAYEIDYVPVGRR